MKNRLFMTAGRVSYFGAILTLIVAALVGTPTAAQAYGPKCFKDSATDPWWAVCVNVTSQGVVDGHVRWYYADGYFNPGYVWVQRCRVNMTGCGIFSQNMDSRRNIVSVTPKDGPYGHVYRACTTFSVYYLGRQYNTYVDERCSPWSSWP